MPLLKASLELGGRVDGLHRNPMFGVLLPNRRKKVDRPLSPGLVGRNVDVLHAQLCKLPYVGLVPDWELRAYVHQVASLADWLGFTRGRVIPQRVLCSQVSSKGPWGS